MLYSALISFITAHRVPAVHKQFTYTRRGQHWLFVSFSLWSCSLTLWICWSCGFISVDGPKYYINICSCNAYCGWNWKLSIPLSSATACLLGTHTGVTNIQLYKHPTVPRKQMSTGCQMCGCGCLDSASFITLAVSWFAGRYLWWTLVWDSTL